VAISLSKQQQQPLEAVVQLGGETATLLVRKPTYKDRLKYDALYAGQRWEELYEFFATHLCGWKDFLDETGKELAYVPGHVQIVLSHQPVYRGLIDFVWGLYLRQEKDAEGKAPSSEPSATSLTAETATAPPS
jgi:hypothetical protein